MISREEYALSFFKEKGFISKKCPICGSWFWTLDPDQKYCNDAPCVEYKFFEIPAKPGLHPLEAREDFIEFFKRRGHAPVKPRPVVARWRDDLYLTIASIVVFQPFVTGGIAPPPANPLVISQPCIRLEDIDNVGKTAGRHLSSFEMAAHHAFNYPNKEVYWKEDTVRLAFEYFTESLKIPENEIAFKESWWEGGGNAGPSFEAAVGGLELATLVFMKYKVTSDGSYVEMPLKVVDTGYGVERIAWMSTKAPTGFHAIFGDLVRDFHKALDIEEPPEDILYTVSRLSFIIDLKEPKSIDEYYAKISKATGLSIHEVTDLLKKLENVYALLDHTKTISLMLGDGIVPSNTGEGYLARLVIRRAIRALSRLKSGVSLVDLVGLQLKYLIRRYPQISARKEYILDVVELEERRFKETISRGVKLLERMSAKFKKKGMITLDDVVLLYDSHGIPTEIVREYASKIGVEVEIPANFYSIIASRHAKPSPRVEVRRVLPEEILGEISGLKPTRPLFHENPYQMDFDATVLRVLGERYIILDKTCFYPEGGGQLSDTGILQFNDKTWSVKSVYKVGDVIVHEVDKRFDVPPGTIVRGRVDSGRRLSLMKHHTATHIILGAARRVLGDHVWQAGAEKTVSKARLDITHYKPLSREEIYRIENLANKVVWENRTIHTSFIERNMAEEKYGFSIYQGGVPGGEKIRIVEIDGWDAQACYGTHCSRTGEVGVVKILRTDRIQDGVIRLEFAAGEKALEHIRSLEDRMRKIASMLQSPLDFIESRIKSILDEQRSLKKRLSIMEEEIIRRILSEIESTKKCINGVCVATVSAGSISREGAAEIAKQALSRDQSMVLVILYSTDGKTKIEIFVGPRITELVDAGIVLSRIGEKFRVKGGGAGRHAEGVIVGEASFSDIKSEVLRIVEDISKVSK